MRDGFDEADYLAPTPRSDVPRPAWLRLGLPIAAIILVAGGAAVAIGLSTPRVYEAEVAVELIRPETVAADVAMPGEAQRITVARSSAVAGAAISQLALLDDPRFLTANPSLDSAELDAATRQQRATAIVLRNMDTGIGELASFARIAYRSSDPVLAADIANALAESFIPADAQQVVAATGGSRAELQALVDQIRDELDAAESGATDGESDGEEEAESEADALPSAATSPVEETAMIAAPDNNAAFIAQERSALESQLGMVRTRLARVEAQIAAGIAGTDDPVIMQLQQSREDLQREYQRITEQFRADYPAALGMREQIDLIDATLAREAVRLAEDRAAEAQQLRIQQTDLLARIEVLSQQAAASSVAGLPMGDAAPDIAAKRELYNLLVARLAAEEANVENLPTTARVISAALPPTRPVIPDWRLLIGGALLVAMLLSGLVIWLDMRRQKRRAHA